MAAAIEGNDDFMQGPLVIWLRSSLENPSGLTEYEDLVDGVLIYQVLLQIDPEPTHTGVLPSLGNTQIRIRNLDIILKNIRYLYQEELGQMIIMVPNVVRLGSDPGSAGAKQDMTLLLLLLLSCAVQCPNKEIFIDRIKLLAVDVQHSIVDCIKQVTDTPLMVLGPEPHEGINPDLLLDHLRHVVKERDHFLQSWATSVTIDNMTLKADTKRQQTTVSESHHLAVELADWKSRLRKQRLELEEKTEALTECKEELEHYRTVESKLRQEVADVVQEARSAKAYRDELDAMREKAERAEKLESEVQRFKDKLSDIDFYKTRVQELREDNRVLLETREMLEDQLQRARRRGDHVLELEAEILNLNQQLNQLTLERDAKDKKLEELYVEHAQLEVLARSALQGNHLQPDSEWEQPAGCEDASLSEQLTSNATARALRLELENRKLLSTIENLKETSFHENSNKIYELETENQKLTSNIEQLEESCRRLTSENKELESLVKESLQENRKLQESKDALRATTDRQQVDIQEGREQVENFQADLEKSTKEKDGMVQRIKELEASSIELEELKAQSGLVPSLKDELASMKNDLLSLEKELHASQRDVVRFKETIEEKDVKLDELASRCDKKGRECESLLSEVESVKSHVARLHEVEREKDDVCSRAAIMEDTLTALKAELISEKVTNQQLKSGMERLGLTAEMLLDPEVSIRNLLSIPEVTKELHEACERCRGSRKDLTEDLATLQNSAEVLQSDNAHLQVLVATLQSQITSLTAQHTALQLANSQLVAEKEELAKERSSDKTSHEQLLSDQVALQSLHEQLSTEHEAVLRERESLRQAQRDLVKEVRALRDLVARQEASSSASKLEKDVLKADSLSLGNLRAEHSKLKDDFRNLFTTSEKVKAEYRAIQEEYKTVRAEASSLRLRHTELQGETASLSDHSTHLQLQLTKVANQNEMLLQMNTNLEEDRRSLMEHVSRLLSQYHELLTHSLEDKQHYHTEEKLFADKVNHLSRQKEKLEEKIMDHYKKLESCSNKKKGFGANLVRRVRKAGTDLINKSRRSWHEDSRQSSMTLHGSESGGNESDASLDDSRPEEVSTHPMGFPHSLNQQGAGTRQTVYYNQETKATGTDPCPADDSPSLLVFNRVSAVIGGAVGADTPKAPPSPNMSVRSHMSQVSTPKLSPMDEAKRKAKKENPIWYEYGCV